MRLTLPMARTAKGRSGFALVIALSLMAFVLLLILSITSFVVVEQQSANIAKQQLTAKQNALVGLQIAIGELQQRLGPDQRATASADILNSSNNPYTLVWHSDPTKGWDGATKDWITGGDADFALPLLSVDPAKLNTLISSGGEFNESALDNPVELMTITNPGDGTLTSLKAERRPLVDAQGATTGNYAWVAQDESLKANLKTEHGDYQNTDSGLDLVETSRRLSVFPYANAAGIEIEGALPFDTIQPVVNGKLNDDYFEKIQKAEDLSDLITSGLLDPVEKSGSNAEQLASYRNHFTLNSKGVLADAKNGGLRRDLSRGLDDQYFEKLHGVPVFGIDSAAKSFSATETLSAIRSTPSLIADGINAPVGDPWKILRDYYNFYRPVDDTLGKYGPLEKSENTFYGLDNPTQPNPKTRMRLTHEDIARGLTFMYEDNGGGRYGNEIFPYSANISPLTPTPRSNPKRDFSITNDDWFLLTPQIRPVVLKNTLKLGFFFEEIVDPANAQFGKYILFFRAYPSFTLWNPFNVAIDFNPSTSPNSVSNASVVKFNHTSNIAIQLEIENGGSKELRQINLENIAPDITAIDKDTLSNQGLPTQMPPGAVWVMGLTQNYSTDSNSSISVDLAPASVSSISEDNHVLVRAERIITKEVRLNRDGTPRLDNNGNQSYYRENEETVYFDAEDEITLFEESSRKWLDEFRWWGIIESNGESYKCFRTGENADLPKPNSIGGTGTYVGKVKDLTLSSSGTLDLFPLITINFKANTTSTQTNSPSFPAFAQINTLGANPLVVAMEDGRGDVKALYHRQRSDGIDEDFTSILPERAPSGRGFYGESFDSGVGVSRITLYDLPRHPIISITDFKNLTLGWHEDTHARPIGASWPLSTLFDLSNTYIRNAEPNGYKTGSWADQSSYNQGAGCDTSYLYNDTLFDGYFFSGIPSEDRDSIKFQRNHTFPYGIEYGKDYVVARSPIANTRLSYYKTPDLDNLRGLDTKSETADGFEKAAACLMIDAPFNINSTSAKAWQAILSGFRGQDIVGVDGGISGSDRSKKNYRGFESSPFVDNFIPSGNNFSLSGEKEDIYAGYRRLNDAEIISLSEKIVKEIRDRGASRTLGAFVNRDLQGTINQKKMGRIDAAIKAAGFNTFSDSSHYADRYSNPDKKGARMFKDSIVEDSYAGLSGYIKQQDVLRPLAPIMTSRGDTFTLRCYGETTNPASGQISGKAWCEAVLQRLPDYVDSSLDPWEKPKATNTNKRYERTFKVVQFRWLHSENI